MDSTYDRLRRVSSGRTALSTLAGVFLLASALFWAVLHWTSLVVPGAGIPQIIVAIVMTTVYALALPLLLSMFVPTTPAGQMLQRTQWRTIGFPVIIASALFLAWHARTLMLLWFQAQPTIAESGQETAYTLACLIAFVVIPALAWVQATPERWLQEISQAHMVHKLAIEQRGELAIIRARMVWAESRAAMSYARLLPAEQQEVCDTLRGLLMGVSDNQRAIARTMGIQGDVERGILGDQEIADTLSYVAEQLEKPAEQLSRAVDLYIPGEPTDQAHVHTRSTSSIPRDGPGAPRNMAQHGAPQPYDREYTIAIVNLRKPVWTAQDLANLLEIEKRTAQESIARWREMGLIEQTRIGRYKFAEGT